MIAGCVGSGTSSTICSTVKPCANDGFGAPVRVRRQFNSAIIALRSRGQNDELRISEL
jgi:hypothetical protein